MWRIKSLAEQREDKRRCGWDRVSEEQDYSDGVLGTRNVLLREVDLQQDDQHQCEQQRNFRPQFEGVGGGGGERLEPRRGTEEA